jgi:hypothetical protein
MHFLPTVYHLQLEKRFSVVDDGCTWILTANGSVTPHVPEVVVSPIAETTNTLNHGPTSIDFQSEF